MDPAVENGRDKVLQVFLVLYNSEAVKNFYQFSTERNFFCFRFVQHLWVFPASVADLSESNRSSERQCSGSLPAPTRGIQEESPGSVHHVDDMYWVVQLLLGCYGGGSVQCVMSSENSMGKFCLCLFFMPFNVEGSYDGLEELVVPRYLAWET